MAALSQSAELLSRLVPAEEEKLGLYSKDFAERLDQLDPLKNFRSKFNYPKQAPFTEASEQAIYFCGNSLGLYPKRCKKYVDKQMDKWASHAVEGHFQGERPWTLMDHRPSHLSRKLIGAKEDSEIAIMGTLSSNIHLMMVAFYQPTKERHKIFMEDGAFCSDQHAVRSQIEFHGYDPKTSLITAKHREGEYCLRTEDILETIEKEGDSIALIMFSGLQYYTGQVFDMKTICEAGHKKGCFVGYDLAHIIGNVPVSLHDWGVDFAVWCTYKYLNAGPGGIGGIFVHDKHSNTKLKRFAGWWGQSDKQRFTFGGQHVPARGARGFIQSNPSPVLLSMIEASLELFDEAGFDKIREKSEKLTAYLEVLIDRYLYGQVTIMTPRDKDQRGCQLSLVFKKPIDVVHKRIIQKGVICDVRPPYVMRIAPVPLYNTFKEVRTFVHILKDALREIQDDRIPSVNGVDVISKKHKELRAEREPSKRRKIEK